MTQPTLWKRGLFEAAVILAGILLAFWIDAWWERRQAEQLEREMLAAVLVEVDQNLELLDRTMTTLSMGRDRADRFLRAAPAELDVIPADSVSRWLVELMVPSIFTPELEAASVLTSIPVARRGETADARRLVSRWLSRLESAERVAGRQSPEGLEDALTSYAARSAREGAAGIPEMVARLGPSVLVELRGDDEFVAAVIRRSDARRVYQNGLSRAEQAGTSLAEVLRSH